MAKDTKKPVGSARTKWARRVVMVLAAGGLVAGGVLLARPKPTSVEAPSIPKAAARAASFTHSTP